MLGQAEDLEALADSLFDDVLERARGVFAELARVRVVAVRHEIDEEETKCSGKRLTRRARARVPCTIATDYL